MNCSSVKGVLYLLSLLNTLVAEVSFSSRLIRAHCSVKHETPEFSAVLVNNKTIWAE